MAEGRRVEWMPRGMSARRDDVASRLDLGLWVLMEVCECNCKLESLKAGALPNFRQNWILMGEMQVRELGCKLWSSKAGTLPNFGQNWI